MIPEISTHNKVAIADISRTPFCKVGGSLATYSSIELAVLPATSILERNPEIALLIGHAIFASPIVAALGSNPALSFSRGCGLSNRVTAHTVSNAGCSGLDAINCGANLIRTGQCEAVIVGIGLSTSNIPLLLRKDFAEVKSHEFLDTYDTDLAKCPFTGFSLLEMAEALAREKNISSSLCNEFARTSRTRAENHSLLHSASRVSIVNVDGDISDSSELCSNDKAEKKFGENGILSDHSCAIDCDGGAAVLLVNSSLVSGKPVIEDFHKVVVSPGDVLTSQATVLNELIERAGGSISESTVVEISEQFSSQAISEIEELTLSSVQVNKFGSDLAFGIPTGVSSIRSLCVAWTAISEDIASSALVSSFSVGGSASAIRISRLKR